MFKKVPSIKFLKNKKLKAAQDQIQRERVIFTVYGSLETIRIWDKAIKDAYEKNTLY